MAARAEMNMEIADRCSCAKCLPNSAEECCTELNDVLHKIKEQKVSCITEHSGFRSNCLDKDVLEVSFYEYLEKEPQVDRDSQVYTLYRQIAYKRFIKWIWKMQENQSNRVLPSCVYSEIKNQFKEPTFAGFQYPPIPEM